MKIVLKRARPFALYILPWFIMISVVLASYSMYVDKQDKIDKLEKEIKVDNKDPYEQPLFSGTASVEIRFRMDNNNNPKFNFGTKGCANLVLYNNDMLLTMTSFDCFYVPDLNVSNEYVYRATTFNLASTEKIGEPLSNIKETDVIGIFFINLPADSNIIDGNITFVFNNSLIIKIPIYHQPILTGPDEDIPLNRIIIHDVGEYFKKGY